MHIILENNKQVFRKKNSKLIIVILDAEPTSFSQDIELEQNS